MGMANGKTMAFASLAENRYGYQENHTDKLATKNSTRTAQRWMVTKMAERLTFEGDFCEIARCKETRWGKYCPDGACSQRKVWERLKEYEDTTMSPNDVREYKKFEDELIASGKTFNDLLACGNLSPHFSSVKRSLPTHDCYCLCVQKTVLSHG